MHRDLQDDGCWAQGVMLRICTVIASLLLIYIKVLGLEPGLEAPEKYVVFLAKPYGPGLKSRLR